VHFSTINFQPRVPESSCRLSGGSTITDLFRKKMAPCY